MRDFKLGSHEGLLFLTWSYIFFCASLLTIFGSIFENQRVLICGWYVMFELTMEFIDCGMCWYERRQPLCEMAIEMVFSAEEKTAEPVDENGRELPLWLKEADEKETAEKALKYTKHTLKSIAINYCFNYGIKLWLLIQYIIAFTRPNTKANLID